MFQTLLEPVLASQGYQGYYSNKASAQLEGCAMFWSLECFERVDELDMGTFCVRDLFGFNPSAPKPSRHVYSKWDSMDSIDTLLCQHDELRKVIREKVGQVLQVATLTLRSENRFAHGSNKKPEKLVVGNTHLFYHPMADHIRAMQAYVVCKQLDTIRRSQKGSCRPPLIMCGDFNSNPMAGAVRVFLERRLGSDHFETWKHLHKYTWEMGDYEFMVEHGYVGNDAETGTEPTYEEEAFVDAMEYEESDVDDESDDAIVPPPLVLPRIFPNLFSGYREMPEFTNLAVDFEETLDYILASEPSDMDPFGFVPKRSAIMPTASEVKQYVAMPNEFMPSDHVSLVCDLEWKTHYDKG